MFYKTEVLEVFIDGSSLYGAARALKLFIDFKRLRCEFERRGMLRRLNYYCSLDHSGDLDPIRGLTDFLAYNGFRVVDAPAKTIPSTNGPRKVRRDVSMYLAVDALRAAENCNHVVIFSGDGDLLPVVSEIQRKGARVSIVSSTEAGEFGMINDELRRAADTFIEINDLSEEIGAPDSTTRPATMAAE